MMKLMDKLTDKSDWHKKVYDEEIVAKWRKEAMEQPEDALYRQITEGRMMEEIPQPARGMDCTHLDGASSSQQLGG